MHEIRIFEYKGQEMPTIYHVPTMTEALIVLIRLQVDNCYKIEVVKMI